MFKKWDAGCADWTDFRGFIFKKSAKIRLIRVRPRPIS